MNWYSEYLPKLPPFVPRKNVTAVLGGIVSPKTLANADSLGIGPSKRWKLGRDVVYDMACLLEWLDSRSRLPQVTLQKLT